jgi:hypothetical protein
VASKSTGPESTGEANTLGHMIPVSIQAGCWIVAYRVANCDVETLTKDKLCASNTANQATSALNSSSPNTSLVNRAFVDLNPLRRPKLAAFRQLPLTIPLFFRNVLLTIPADVCKKLEDAFEWYLYARRKARQVERRSSPGALESERAR